VRILVTGSSGVLGQDLCRELVDEYEVVGLDVRAARAADGRGQVADFVKIDITDRDEAIEKISGIDPAIVIHAAAYTDVDGCELDPDRAREVNAIGTQNVALACRGCDIPIFYLSTDFVFDGNKKAPYTESDRPNPLNIYGKSKLDGEGYVGSLLDKFLIIRTSWLFGRGGKNFVDTIVDEAKRGKVLKVVNDQFGSPTYTKDLSRAIEGLINKVLAEDRIYGIYHITNGGGCSWYEFAVRILEYSNGENVAVMPITSNELDYPARRPKMSILDNSRYIELTGERLRPWSEALREYLC